MWHFLILGFHLFAYVVLNQAGTALQASGYNIIDEDDSDTKSFSLDCGAHTGYFSIASDTGITSFATRYDADDVTRLTSYSCTVTVTDSGGLTDTATLLISIGNRHDLNRGFRKINIISTL